MSRTGPDEQRGAAATATAEGQRSKGDRLTIAVIALATPAALGLETAARWLFLPAELARLRQELQPALTPLAWGLCALTALAVPLGVGAKRALSARFLARVRAAKGGAKKEAEARFEALFVATSIPQLPAVLATFALTCGAEALPALLAALASAAGVLIIAAIGGVASGPGDV